MAISKTRSGSQFGVYIHYPWCRKLCPYCDFAILVTTESPPDDDWKSAILTELGERTSEYPGRQLYSLYFGGGTPGLASAEVIAELVATVKARFPSSGRPVEVTLEANPNDCTPRALSEWRDAGITRLSIGTQALADDALVILGRDHDAQRAAVAVSAARAAGFEQISADVIMGVPGSAHALESIDRLIALGVDHLSVYELTIEPRTAFAAAVERGELARVDDHEIAALYQACRNKLLHAGFEHYEISSYARPGSQSLHNRGYWHGAEYLGLGNAAASFRRHPDGTAERRTNIRAGKAYLRCGGKACADEVVEIDATNTRIETLWLAMRTAAGAPVELWAGLEELQQRLYADGLVTVQDARVQPTLRGFMYADEIARQLVVAGAQLERSTD